ncbi:hypothetical protein [Pantoea sp. Fr+CA_20]|uniref:head-tail joining protein n=1 Tax=Pantoea sp. Fr+CA_20 TaxID=2929506 RepID=UPI0021186B55|nr:hypothetical protein [Pantoea sp. Fr+CA_20]
MSVNWDQHLLAPLHGIFGDAVEFRPNKGRGQPYTINGIFDRAYTQDVQPMDAGDPSINTTKPVLGVRDAEFRSPPRQGDQLYIAVAGGRTVNQLFVIADVQPDSHGGTKLVLNEVRG